MMSELIPPQRKRIIDKLVVNTNHFKLLTRINIAVIYMNNPPKNPVNQKKKYSVPYQRYLKQ